MEKYDFDTTEFDCLVFGTDLPESILVATLANKGKKVLNIEFDNSYSGSLISPNLKDFVKFMLIEENNKDIVYSEKKTFFGDGFESFEDILEKINFRGFNIDIEPKFLLSSALSTMEMINIGLDNYLSF